MTLRAGDIDGHRLLQVHMLATGDHSLEVLRMEVGWRRDDNGVHFLRSSDLLVGPRSDKQLLRIESRVPFRLLQLIEVSARRVELVLNRSAAQRHELRPCPPDATRLPFRVHTAEQADADG
jgi:hypothetical protein